MKLMNRMKLSFESKNFKKVKKIMKREIKYRELERTLIETHLKRVQKKRAESVATHSIHMELLDMLKQINVYMSEIAKTLIKLEHEETEE
jgi:phosphate:Na+ symporter